MLDPDYLEQAGELVASVYVQIEAEMLDYLAGRMIAGDVANQRSLTALNNLVQSDQGALRGILDSHRDEIADAVREEVSDALRRSDADDLRRIKEGMGVELPAITTRQLATTVAGVERILARQNLKMPDDAKRAFLEQSAWAVTQVNTGAMTTERALHAAVRRLEREGVSTVTYRNAETGAQTVRNKVDVAVRRHIRTQIAQDSMRRTEQVLDDAGVELVEVSSHAGSRPSHQEWEGRVYSRSGDKVIGGVRYRDFRTACCWGDVANGIGGANCRHSYAAYFPGMERAYRPNPRHPSGMSNTQAYELTQRQRALERGIRATKRELRGAQMLYGADPSIENLGAVEGLKRKLRARQAKVRELVAANPKVLQRSPRREWAGAMPKGASVVSRRRAAMASDGGISWPNEGRRLSKEEKADLRAYARDRGIELAMPKACDADPAALRRYVDAAERVASEFPELLGDEKHPLTIRVSALPNKDFGFSPSRARHIVDVNEASLRSAEALAAEYGRLADEGWFVPGTSYEAVIYHELGHRYASRNKISGMRIARAIIGSRDKEYLELQIKKRLSTYASSYENGSEIISEVFSAWFSNTGNKFAEQVMQRILELR